MARKALKGRDPATLTWKTPEGIDVKPLYTADDVRADVAELPGKVRRIA